MNVNYNPVIGIYTVYTTHDTHCEIHATGSDRVTVLTLAGLLTTDDHDLNHWGDNP